MMLSQYEGASPGLTASVRCCWTIAVSHMFCLFMFWVHNQSNTMTISSKQNPNPFPPPKPTTSVFSIQNAQHGAAFHWGVRSFFLLFSIQILLFQVTSPLSAPVPVMVLYPLMNHKQGVLRSLLTEGQL